MKLFVHIALILALSLLAMWFLPWWSAAGVAFAVGLLLSERRRRGYSRKKTRSWSFLAGFVALFLLWGVWAWKIDFANQSLLSNKIALVLTSGAALPLPGAYAMILLSALAGGLMGGASSLSGGLLGQALRRGR
ncbi:MAG: hypothetical protein EAZ89_16065 [Bacteroidetes bacterium]|nr:MAG: hypothetical protein EAZ89_16065 [Bacteroidota bacterium]